jgi:hypothetical protein
MTPKSGKEMAKQFADFVNGGDRDDFAEFAEELCHRTHRTLQQSAFGVMLDCIRLWAQNAAPGNFDLRNEATVKLAEKIFTRFDDEFYLPLI